MNNTKKVNLEKLFEYEQSLLNNNDFVVSQNALVNNHLYEVLLDINRLKRMDDNFSHNIRNDGAKITDQKQSGRCWIFATLNTIRDKFISDYNLENFEFSQSYIAFYDKLEKANYFLNLMIEHKDTELSDRTLSNLLSDPVSDGGYFQMAQNLIQKYGLVPKSEMPDTFIAKNTYFLNKIIDVKLKQATIEIRNNPHNEEKITDIKNSTLNEIYKILSYCYGEIPETFDIELKNKDKKDKTKKWYGLTPKTFLKKINFDFDDYIAVVHTPYKKIKPFQNYKLKYSAFVHEKGDLNFTTVDKTSFKMLALAMLYQNKSFWFACDVDHYMNRNLGIFDNKLYDFDNFFDIEFNKDISTHIEYRHVGSNHAMVLQGFDLDDKKWQKTKAAYFKKHKSLDCDNFEDLVNLLPINKWNIENSWGDKNGNKGLFLMSNEWFENYTYEIIISKKAFKEFLKKPNFLSKKDFSLIKRKTKDAKHDYLFEKHLNKAINTKPIYLDLWHPFNAMLRGNKDEK